MKIDEFCFIIHTYTVQVLKMISLTSNTGFRQPPRFIFLFKVFSPCCTSLCLQYVSDFTNYLLCKKKSRIAKDLNQTWLMSHLHL